jgi:hypothetical protein
MKRISCLLSLTIIAASATVNYAASLGTSMTYQGRLNSAGTAADGVFDLTFQLFTNATGGIAQRAAVTNLGVDVNNGLFTTLVDLSPVPQDHRDYWLELAVRTNGSGAFIALSPRQPLSSTPFAWFADRSSNALAAVLASNVAPGSVTSASIAVGQVVRSVNGQTDNVILPTNFWSLAGNVGATPGVSFLGTKDALPLDLRVNNLRIAHFEAGAATDAPNLVLGSSVNTILPGVFAATIGGGGIADFAGAPSGNSIGSPFGTVGGGARNRVQKDSNSGTIAGGFDNEIGQDSFDVSIGGGSFNSIGTNSGFGTIAGGSGNRIGPNSKLSTIAGGTANVITNELGSLLGGGGNFLGGYGSVIAGGYYHTNLSAGSVVIAGGVHNVANGAFGTIGGGADNLITNENGTIAGGRVNIAGGLSSTVAGGYQNYALGQDDVVGGGYLNTARGGRSVVAGGTANINEAQNGVIGGGDGNVATPVTAFNAVIGGGYHNTNNSDKGFIGGGALNLASGYGAVVAGGGGYYGDVPVPNAATNSWATVGGGTRNAAGGPGATVPGGNGNLALGENSFAAGTQARALHAGTFAWADDHYSDFASTGPNQFLIRAAGGVGIGTPNPQGSLHVYSDNNPTVVRIQSSGGPGLGRIEFVSDPQGSANEWRPAFIQSLDTGGFSGGLAFCVNGGGSANKFATQEVVRVVSGRVGIMTNNPVSALHVRGTVTATAFNPSSDRNLKENFTPVTARSVLERVAALPISEWSFQEDPDTRHIGPMAQDFHAQFGLGTDDRHIATVDADGVALAAIQGLNQKVDAETSAMRELLRAKEIEIQELQKTVARLEQALASMQSRQ